jgi:hypothetical protein
MCITHELFKCGHTEEAFKQCKHYQERAKTAHRKKVGFWKYIFTPVPVIKCILPPGRRHIMNRKCKKCTRRDKKEAARLWEEEVRQAEATEAWEQAQNEKLQQRWRSQKKWAWVCDRCAVERRRIHQWQREANEGACCARGLDEYEVWEKKQGYRTLTSGVPSRTRASPPRKPTREENRAQLRHATSRELARLEADAAARRYGWTDDRSPDLPPDVVRGFVAMSGMDPRDLSGVPPEQQPLYEEPRIDWDRWSQSRRTAQGSYPPPARPPDGPLPVRPLARRSTGMQARVDKPVEAHRSSTIPRGPVPSPVVAPERRRRMGSSRGPITPTADANRISPPSSPVHSKSPVSPMSTPELRSARSVISNLNHQLDSAIDYFREPEEPVPSIPW